MSAKDSCNDLESSNRPPSIRSPSEKKWLKHLDNQVSNHLSLAEDQDLIQEILEKTDIVSDDDLEDTGDYVYCHCKPEEGVELKKCSRCRVTHYCSVNCPREWTGHFLAWLAP